METPARHAFLLPELPPRADVPGAQEAAAPAEQGTPSGSEVQAGHWRVGGGDLADHRALARVPQADRGECQALAGAEGEAVLLVEDLLAEVDDLPLPHAAGHHLAVGRDRDG